MPKRNTPSPIVPASTFTERQGIHHLALVASQMDMVWRETPNTDLGIDGYLEVIVNGVPIGLIAVQVKAGPSYMNKPRDNRSFTFYAKRNHVGYWLNYRLPVIIIVYDPKEQSAYWRYIQDYFRENDQQPKEADTIPILIYKTSVFDKSSLERLTEIAASPDSTAPALLAVRASRYKFKQELLTQGEMLELYSKRGWLGEWIPLDNAKEEILLHSTLARRGPGWFWFRSETNRSYTSYLRNALKHKNHELRKEAALALAATIEREAIEDLRDLLASDSLIAANALASISDFTSEERVKVFHECFKHLQQNKEENEWPKNSWLDTLSILAKIGRTEAREKVVKAYFQTIENSKHPPLLREAGSLWLEQELTTIRKLAEENSPALRTLAIATLAQIGEPQDINLILNYVQTFDMIDGNDLQWLAQHLARLFGAEHLEDLRQMVQGDYNLQIVAFEVLPDLCRRLEKNILCQMLNDPMELFRVYAAENLAFRGELEILAEHKEHLEKSLYELEAKLQTEEYSNSDLSATAHQIRIVLAAFGDWTLVNKLLKNEYEGARKAVATGLRCVSENHRKEACKILFKLLREDEDSSVRLEAGNSLSLIGDEEVVQDIVKWLSNHLQENTANIISSVLIYLDYYLYCPKRWTRNTDRDFSILRYSVTRDDYL
jgi:HEAT repeat protein